MPDSESTEPNTQAQFDALIATIPDGAEAPAQVQGFNALNRAFKQRLIKRLEPALNATIQGMESGTFEQKEKIADFVNETLGSYGLAVKCPRSRSPAELKADVGDWPGIGRFQIRSRTSDGRRYRTSSNTLPILELVEIVPPELEVNWKTIIGPKESRSVRKRTD